MDTTGISPFLTLLQAVRKQGLSDFGLWALKFGYNRAQILEGASRQLVRAGQTSVDTESNPQHAGDMRTQMTLAPDNIEAVLDAVGMGLANITRLNIHAADADEAMENFDLLGARFGPLNAAPPMTVVGVTRLAILPLIFEIEVTAAA